MFDSHYIKTLTNGLLTKIKSIRFDWNVNDPGQEGYIKNRTHYKENITRLVVDNLSSSSIYDGNIPRCNFTPKWTYDVIYNGTLYEGLICYSEDEYNCIGEYGKHPFYIDDDGGNNFCIECEDEEFTVSITEHATIVHKLDEEYLPDGLITKDKAYTKDEVYNKDELADVATSGNYYDLINRPIVYSDVVLYSTTQHLTNTQKSKARTNIDAQKTIIGTAGQMVGFDASGNAIAQEAPKSVPEVTTTDNGKFLRVVDGAWSATTVPNAEEVAF